MALKKKKLYETQLEQVENNILRVNEQQVGSQRSSQAEECRRCRRMGSAYSAAAGPTLGEAFWHLQGMSPDLLLTACTLLCFSCDGVSFLTAASCLLASGEVGLQAPWDSPAPHPTTTAQARNPR